MKHKRDNHLYYISIDYDILKNRSDHSQHSRFFYLPVN